MEIDDMLFKVIEEFVDENIDVYNTRLINDSSIYSDGLDRDDWFDYVFAIFVMRFVFKSMVDVDDISGDFQILTFENEDSVDFVCTIDGNFKTKTFNFKESFFVKFLPSIYVPMFYKHREYVEQCIIYIDEKYKNLDE